MIIDDKVLIVGECLQTFFVCDGTAGEISKCIVHETREILVVRGQKLAMLLIG